MIDDLRTDYEGKLKQAEQKIKELTNDNERLKVESTRREQENAKLKDNVSR